MLAWNAAARPSCAVADIRALPLAAASVNDTVAAFVLNHLTDPATDLAELARVTRPGGAVLATVFSSHNTSGARDRIDAAAQAAGWQAPAWYTDLKASAVRLLGHPAAMAAAARAAGLVGVRAGERPVNVGITQPHQLVTYRLGHPIFAVWLDALGPSRARAFAAEAERAIREAMQPYRPVVVFSAPSPTASRSVPRFLVPPMDQGAWQPAAAETPQIRMICMPRPGRGRVLPSRAESAIRATVRIATVTLRDHSGRLTGEVKHRRWATTGPASRASARPGMGPGGA